MKSIQKGILYGAGSRTTSIKKHDLYKNSAKTYSMLAVFLLSSLVLMYGFTIPDLNHDSDDLDEQTCCFTHHKAKKDKKDDIEKKLIIESRHEHIVPKSFSISKYKNKPAGLIYLHGLVTTDQNASIGCFNKFH